VIGRVLAIAMNTHREAVRARVLLGLIALALAATVYSLVIAAMSLRQEMRIVADTGAFVISVGSIVVAIVLGATSLYRELELKTVFPILTRRLRRHEYLLGKYLGILGTLVAFIAIDGATVLGILALQSKQNVGASIGAAVGLLALLGVGLWRAKHARVFVVLPWALLAFAVMAFLSTGAGGERQILLVSVVLTTAEVAIVTAVAMLFSSFSSPFLTAMFTLMLVLIGRSADTLANLPERLFGRIGHDAGVVVAAIVPNLNVYVPARPLMLGELPGVSLAGYVARAWGNAFFYSAVLLALSAIVFRRRDFQ
jgi:ABC-type transport system involved in multi-copper enzyme maturation permease subunit